jgi:class 3 adenylate cyclase
VDALTRPVALPQPSQFRLRFPNSDLETDFLLDFGRQAVRPYRLVVPFVLMIWLSFGLLDHRISTEGLATVRIIRFGVVTPLLLAAMAFGYTRVETFARYWQLVLAAGFATMLGAIVVVTKFVSSESLSHNPAAISLVLVGGYTLVMLRFMYATVVAFLGTVATTAMYTHLYGVRRVFVDAADTGLIWIVLANVIGMFACHQLERSRRQRFVHQRLIDEERERAEALLRNILPASVAERLKAGGTPPVDAFESATVLFGDLVGFTALAERLTPRELVRQLNELFTEFDEIAERLGLEKIKTIGDGYMVVGGVPERRDDHAAAVADMALEMLAVIDRRRDTTREPLDIRIGIATGPLVAGVIGTKKFSYDVWGDTVNTASRMETHGVSGAVHISADTHAALTECGVYEFESRGVLDVKGKGDMSTYLLKRT